jgi:hypothetical protein
MRIRSLILSRALWSLLLLAALGLAGAPVSAQDEVEGIAIAQAPEGVFQACHGGNADQTLACARRECRDAGGEQCLRVRWCYPAGWSGAMTYLANREVTQTLFLCGASSGPALIQMLAAQCASEEGMSECRLSVAWAPDGTESEPLTLLGKNSAP